MQTMISEESLTIALSTSEFVFFSLSVLCRRILQYEHKQTVITFIHIDLIYFRLLLTLDQ